MKILFRAPNWLGDAVVSRILLYNIKDHQITVLCKDNLKDVFYDFPHLTFKNKKELLLRSLELRRERFDLGLVVPLSFSSAFFMYIANPKERIGFSFEKRDMFLTKRIKIPSYWKKRHTIYTQFLLLEEMGIKPSIPSVYFKPSCTHIKRFDLPEKYFAIAPFAAFGSAKEWFFENYVELASKLSIIYNVPTVLLAARKDLPRLKDKKLPECIIPMAGKTDLMEAACIIQQSLLLIGNDSGLAHLSASMGHPTLTIFGPTSPTWTKPLGPGSFTLWYPTSCAPCFKRECPFKTKECMKKIDVRAVMKYIETILKKINQKGLKDKK